MKLRDLIVASMLALAPMACELGAPSKVAAGQHYQSGDAKYDPYFDAVHKEQLAASNWADESKAARRPIVTALALPPTASNSTIVSAAKEKKGDGNIGRAIEETSAAESELARKLNAEAARLEEMEKKGEELKKQASEDRRNMGADKADEKKVEKKDEIKREISAAVDVVGDLAESARKGAKQAEELVAKLKAVWDGKEEPAEKSEKPKKAAPKPKEKDDDEKPAEKKPAPPPPPAHKPAEKKPEKKPEKKREPEEKKPEEKPVAKPAGSQKPPEGEVFNP
jgi:hypothetical protein